MKGDFSRLTFDQSKHYRRVLKQQGRVEIDADGNEQAAIDDHIAATTTYDVIGQSGYPLVDLPNSNTPAGGFALALSPAAGPATDVTISTGRMYVEGLLVENDDANASLLNQPDMPGAALSDLGVTGPGVYVVYLDVWERLITALDDPEIQETALGGPDTGVRAQLVWQAKLGYAQALPTGGAIPTCATVPESWRPAAAQGTLAAGSGAPVSNVPCILPPTSGYQQLENQLYRAEIHEGGNAGTATFKWSRENGSVVVGVVQAPGGTGAITGPAFNVTGLKTDATLDFQAGDWVELSDDKSELLDGHGELLQVASTGPGLITTSAAATQGVDPTLHPKLRRWDQTGTTAGATGVATTPGTWVPLEGGVQVEFSDDSYNVGDYWLIPARTATSVQQGYVEWPVDTLSNPVPLPAEGIRHHYAQLGLVEFDGTVFAGLGSATEPTDCRLPFPALTDLMPEQSLSPCTIVVAPGPGWEAPILAYFQNNPAPADAEICFQVGDFRVATPLAIANAGNVKITGGGWGTRLIGVTGADGPTSVMTFANCQSVSLCDMYVETSTVPTQGGISGTLAFSDCGEVTVEGICAQCGNAYAAAVADPPAGKQRPVSGTCGAACITISTGVARPKGTADTSTTGPGSARVRNCRLWVGEMQVGLQLINQSRATIEDNEVALAANIPSTSLATRFADPLYLAAARRYLVSGAVTTAQRAVKSTEPADEADAAAPSEPQETAIARAARIAVNLGGQTLHFTASPTLQSTWQTYLDEHAPKEFATQTDALNYVKAAAKTILTTPSARAGLSAFGTVLQTLEHHQPLAARGIVVGGQSAGDIRILNNSLSGVLMGISVGVSNRSSAKPPQQRTPDHMQTVQIVRNTIACAANDIAGSYGRFGVVVGNADSLEIEHNRLTLSTAGITTAPFADAIRVCGYLGAKAVIRHNHTTQFGLGIRVIPLTGNGPGTPAAATDLQYVTPLQAGKLWLVADNCIEQAMASTPPAGPFSRNLPAPVTHIEAQACTLVNNVYS